MLCKQARPMCTGQRLPQVQLTMVQRLYMPHHNQVIRQMLRFCQAARLLRSRGLSTSRLIVRSRHSEAWRTLISMQCLAQVLQLQQKLPLQLC